MTIEASFAELDPSEYAGEKGGVRVHGTSAESRGMTGQTIEVRRKDGQNVGSVLLGRELRPWEDHSTVYAWTRPEAPSAMYGKKRGYLPARETDEPEWEAAYAREAYDRQHPDEPLFARE